jgi:formate hydrogenlyase subunit 4
MRLASIAHLLLAFALAPLLLGVVNRTKAVFAGRTGPPLLQGYCDLLKLLRKGEVRSRTTTWVFGTGPLVGRAATAVAAATLPMAGAAAPIAFPGDFVLLAYLLGLARFFTVVAALDTGSAFEGMGASREVALSALVEPTLFLGLVALGRRAGAFSLSGMYQAATPELWAHAGPELALVAVALMVIVLAENSRIPVDDPNTHLELTMIHEVMVLDHSGPTFAGILYGAALKLWVLGALFVGLVLPVRTGNPWLDGAAFLAGMLGLAVVIGVIESVMARLRLVRLPQMLAGAGALAALALVLSFR